MKTHPKPVRAAVRIALLLAASLTASQAVQVAIPAQADLQIHEDLGVDGASAFNAAVVNTLNDQTGLKNEIIALRFDLTGKNRLQSTKAYLKLINAKQNTTSQHLSFYGVKNGATGYNETTSTAGTATDNDWPENGTVFSTTPGLRYDASSATEGVDINQTTYLGDVVVDNGNRDEGAEVILATDELQNFLTTHQDDVVTILISAVNNNTSQKRFATKEATSLDTILTPVPAGTYAPRLFLDLPGTTVKASADAQVNELNGSSTTPTSDTGSGTSTNLNSRYATNANGERNEVIVLRFDLTSVTPGQITAADLRLVNHRLNATSSNRIHIYGVNHGAKGRNAITGLDGTYTDNDWPESSPTFSQTPGLEFDNSVVTQNSVLTDRVTDLGSTYVSAGNGNQSEGGELIFSTDKLKDFLVNHPDRIVTILLVADAPTSNNQKRFSSREATSTETLAQNAPVGTFAPTLNLMITPSASFAIKNITLSSGTSQIALTWESQPGQVFRITHSQTLTDGFPAVTASNIPAAAGTTTTLSFPNPVPAAKKLFFRVERP